MSKTDECEAVMTVDASSTLRPDDLAALAYWLREREFCVNPAQLIAANRLLAGTTKLPPVASLAPYLAPILCTSAAEQESFSALYAKWVAERDSPQQPANTSTETVPGTEQPPTRTPRHLRLPPPLLGDLAVPLLIAGIAWITQPYQTVVSLQADSVLQPLEQVSTTNPKVGIRKQDETHSVLSYRRRDLPFTVIARTTAATKAATARRVETDLTEWRPDITLVVPAASAPPETTLQDRSAWRTDVIAPPLPERQAGSGAREKYALNVTALVCALLVLLLLVCWWLITAARRRGFLERLPADGAEVRKRLASASSPALTAHGSALRYLSREMRQRQPAQSALLDVRATLSATMRAGGRPTPKFGSVVEPDYLVLVDRTGSSDHQAAISMEVVRALWVQGVSIELYVFERDPRFVFHAPLDRAALHLGAQSLALLLSRHAGSRLLLLSDGDGLIDRYTGQPGEAARMVMEFPMSALLTPQPRRLWGQREWMVSRSGIAMMPLDGEGLRDLGKFYRENLRWEGPTNALPHQTRPPYLRDVDLLLDRRPLDPDTLATLMASLEKDLGAQGMDWLACCAIYPEVHLAITLAMGDCLPLRPASALEPAAQNSAPSKHRRGVTFASLLAQLARLPWMRAGFMPDWFRLALLTRLPSTTEKLARITLENYLSHLREADRTHGGEDTLEIVVSAPQRIWRDVLAGARAWRERRPQSESVEDAIFLRFMSGRKNALTVKAGDQLMRLLYRDGVPLSGPRFLPLALAIGLAALSFLVPPITRMIRPAPAVVVKPAPTLIALAANGERLIIADTMGGISINDSAKRSDTAKPAPCYQKGAGEAPMSLSAADRVTYITKTSGATALLQLDALCRPVNSSNELQLLQIGGSNARLSALPLTALPPDSAEVICSNVYKNSLVIARRSVLDALLPKDDTVATCAFTADSRAVAVASESGKVYAFSLTGASPGVINRGVLPPRSGKITGLGLQTRVGDIWAVTSTGSVWSNGSSTSWSALGVSNATAPIAVSSDGGTMAFANTAREVEIWSILGPPIKLIPPPNTSTSRGPGRNGPITIKPEVPANQGPGRNGPVTLEAAPLTAETEVTAPPAPVRGVPQKSSEKVSFAAEVFFDFDKAVLNPMARATLDDLLEKASTVKVDVITAVAHTPQNGTDAYNQKLSIRMGEAVKIYLVSKGVEANRIYVEGKGEIQPVASNSTAIGRAKNRRVEIEVVGTRIQKTDAVITPNGKL